MLDLEFRVESATAVPFAAVPQASFRLLIVGPAEQVVHAVTLRCEIQIEATHQTLPTMLWTHVSVVVPTFKGETTVDVPVPCTFDFNVATTRYFQSMNDGEVPLRFRFSGTVFYEDEAAGLRVVPIPSNKETGYRWPLAGWRSLMETYYPNTAWLCLRRDVFMRVFEFKTREGLPTWEDTLERLLGAATPAESAVL